MKLGDEVYNAETICEQLVECQQETNERLDRVIELLTLLVADTSAIKVSSNKSICKDCANRHNTKCSDVFNKFNRYVLDRNND